MGCATSVTEESRGVARYQPKYLGPSGVVICDVDGVVCVAELHVGRVSFFKIFPSTRRIYHRGWSFAELERLAHPWTHADVCRGIAGAWRRRRVDCPADDAVAFAVKSTAVEIPLERENNARTALAALARAAAGHPEKDALAASQRVAFLHGHAADVQRRTHEVLTVEREVRARRGESIVAQKATDQGRTAVILAAYRANAMNRSGVADGCCRDLREVHTPFALPHTSHDKGIPEQFISFCEGSCNADIAAVLNRIDEWDYNVFEMEKVTGGNALMYTTYALLQRLDLIRILKLDEAVVRNFLSALQAGYHPNPYHNATHAADVAQVNYFLIRRGGLIDKCRLSHVTQLAAILAGAIHDFDHPGFNNNFHTRTNAYLATLYNDRSVLENHHLACAFEMMQLPQYNILAPLNEDQYREARDTMIELVLATDMGNHSKIFTAFRQQVAEVQDWTKQEEGRAALSMALKIADTSNTARPKHLYLEWARNIANEFYNQGDYEQRLQLPISLFMDRSKDATEFPKSQISFIKIVVQPMLEAMSTLCPPLKFILDICNENVKYWQKHIDDAAS